MKTAAPREEEGRRRIIHNQPQGGGGGRRIREPKPQGGGGGQSSTFQSNPREEEGAGPNRVGDKPPYFGCGDPREEEGAAAIPTGSGRRKSRSNYGEGQFQKTLALK